MSFVQIRIKFDRSCGKRLIGVHNTIALAKWASAEFGSSWNAIAAATSAFSYTCFLSGPGANWNAFVVYARASEAYASA